MQIGRNNAYFLDLNNMLFADLLISTTDCSFLSSASVLGISHHEIVFLKKSKVFHYSYGNAPLLILAVSYALLGLRRINTLSLLCIAQT